MRTFRYTVTEEQGLHARPAGMLAKKASSFGCDIQVTKGDRTVNAKRVMSIMSLGVKRGMEIIISVDGEDEDVAYEEIKKLMETSL